MAGRFPFDSQGHSGQNPVSAMLSLFALYEMRQRHKDEVIVNDAQPDLTFLLFLTVPNLLVKYW